MNSSPYRNKLPLAWTSALISTLVVSLWDAHGAAKAASLGIGSFLLPTFCLFALPCLVLATMFGLVHAALSLHSGPQGLSGAWKKLRNDDALDANVAAGFVTLLIAGAISALLIAKASIFLVAGVERKSVGALLLGMVSVLVFVGCGLATLPLFAPARFVLRRLPRLPLGARSLNLAVAVFAFAGLVMFWVITRKLDWRALKIGWLTVIMVWFGLFLIGQWLFARLQSSTLLSRWGGLAGLASALILVMAAGSASRISLDAAVVTAITEQSRAAGAIVNVGRKLRDGDKDGYSAFFLGPDCDDRNPAINPDADEIAGNGIDENCQGGDRPLEQTKREQAETTAQNQSLGFDGNVVLIGIDTLRADKLGINGYQVNGKSLSPRMDALLGESVHFTTTYAQAPNTPRSFPSIFSSQYPTSIKFEKSFENYPNPAPENVFLFEVLKDHGFATFGFASHFYFNKAPGISQGFDNLNNEGALDIAGSNKDNAAPRIVPKAQQKLRELAQSKQKFAMFIHLFEPHSTYMEHPGFTITETGTKGLEQKYDYEIAFVDGFVGQILDTLQEQGLDKNTLVILFSDHGEAFGVHKVAGAAMFFHGQTLYDELLRVPFAIRIPGTAPRKIAQVSQLIDLAPTVLGIFGIAQPPSFAGRNWVVTISGKDMADVPAFAELLPAPSWNHSAKAMVSADGQHKAIYRISDKIWEIYNLAKDPQERSNLASAEPELNKTMQSQLLEWMETSLKKP